MNGFAFALLSSAKWRTNAGGELGHAKHHRSGTVAVSGASLISARVLIAVTVAVVKSSLHGRTKKQDYMISAQSGWLAGSKLLQ
jgi:hypothetical protein